MNSAFRILKSATKLAPGAELHGFNVLKVQPIEELQCTALQLRHEATGAQHLHIDTEDATNVFRCVNTLRYI